MSPPESSWGCRPMLLRVLICSGINPSWPESDQSGAITMQVSRLPSEGGLTVTVPFLASDPKRANRGLVAATEGVLT